MSFKPIFAVAALILAVPAPAQAGTVAHTEQTITHDPGAVPPGTKSTLVLKGYKVTTGYTSPSAPVAGDPRYFKNETFVPVEDMVDRPGSMPVDTGRTEWKVNQRRWQGNE